MVAEANWSEQFESVREFFSGTGIALVRLVQQVRKSLIAKKEKVTGETIAKVLADNISWGHASRFSFFPSFAAAIVIGLNFSFP